METLAGVVLAIAIIIVLLLFFYERSTQSNSITPTTSTSPFLPLGPSTPIPSIDTGNINYAESYPGEEDEDEGLDYVDAISAELLENSNHNDWYEKAEELLPSTNYPALIEEKNVGCRGLNVTG